MVGTLIPHFMLFHSRLCHATAQLITLVALSILPSTASSQNCPPPDPITPPWLLPPSTPFRHEVILDGQSHAAGVYVMDLPGGLGRPFVFVEGIDFGLGPSNQPWQNGDFGWREWLGCDPANYPMLAMMPNLVDSIVQRGYTPVLIDFEDGTGDLWDNAALLADILTYLNDYKTDPRTMVVAGASMGGQLARIALKQLEDLDEAHCADLYVSLDSPHCGANVPIGLQQMIQFLAGTGGVVNGLLGALSSPAARQLLLLQLGSLSARNAYQADIDALGWPTHCRTVAIANGATSPLSGAHAPLLDYEHSIIETSLGDAGTLLNMHIHPTPGDDEHPFATDDQGVTAQLDMPSPTGWPWPLATEVGWCPSLSPGLPSSLDHHPGGTRPSMLQFAEAFNAEAAETDVPWPFCIAPIEPSEFQPLHSFIPTQSALGIPLPWTGMNGTDNLTSLSPFDAVHVAATNEPHSQINLANLAFLLDELDQLTPPVETGSWLADVNIVDDGHWALPSLQIGGRCGLHSADTTLSNQPAEEGSHGHFALRGCDGPLWIENSGLLELGASGWNGESSATLEVGPHAEVVVEGGVIIHPGSTLEVFAGGRLRFDGGWLDVRGLGQLRLHEGAEITVDGASWWTCAQDAIAEMNGQLHVEESAGWSVFYSGQAQWSTLHRFDLHGAPGSNVQFTAPSSGTNMAWLLGEGAEIHMDSQGCWTANRVGLQLNGDGDVEMSFAEGQWWSSKWRGLADDTIRVTGDLTFDDHGVDDLHLHHQNGIFHSSRSRFSGGSNHHEDSKINLYKSTFTAHPVLHSASVGLDHSLVQECQFQAASLGLESHGPGTLRLEDSSFDGCAVGLLGRKNRMEILCSHWMDNDIGVRAEGSLLVMSPDAGGGWNVFDHNDTHLLFDRAPLPLLSEGHNAFLSWVSGWAQGTMNVNCTGTGIDWEIPGQHWSWPAGWPQILTGLWAWTPDGDGCPVTALDLAAVDMPDCREAKTKRRE